MVIDRVKNQLIWRLFNLLLVVCISLLSFQSNALADASLEEKLSTIDRIKYGHEYPVSEYSQALSTLSEGCSATTDQVASVSVNMTNFILDHGVQFDNMRLLREALTTSESERTGMNCPDMFALLATVVVSASASE